MAIKKTHAAGDAILASDMNDQAAAILQNQHNIFELFLENFFASKITPVNGIFFDGFSDSTKVGALVDTTIETGNKRLVLDGGFATGSYTSILTSFQQTKASVYLWIVRNFTSQLNLKSSIAQGAITLDVVDTNTPLFNAVTTGAVVGGTSISFSHTTAGTDRFLVVTIAGVDANTVTTTVTYNGVSMTLQARVTSSGTDAKTSVFKLIAPALGANTVLITFGSTVTAAAAAVSLTEVDQADPIDASVTNTTGAAPSITTNITTLTDKTLLLDSLGTNNADNTYTGGAGQTERAELSAGSFEHVVSTKAAPAAGAFTMKQTRDAGPTANASHAHIVIAIKGSAALNFEINDTVDISTSDNLTRERKTVTGVSAVGSTVTITFSPSISLAGGFGTSAFVERVDVLPEFSLVDKGAGASFQSITFQQSIVDFSNSEVEDEYIISVTAEEDFTAKLKLSKASTDVTGRLVFAKRLGVVLVE